MSIMEFVYGKDRKSIFGIRESSTGKCYFSLQAIAKACGLTTNQAKELKKRLLHDDILKVFLHQKPIITTVKNQVGWTIYQEDLLYLASKIPALEKLKSELYFLTGEKEREEAEIEKILENYTKALFPTIRNLRNISRDPNVSMSRVPGIEFFEFTPMVTFNKMMELTGLSKDQLLELTRNYNIFNHNGKITFDIFSLVELKDYIDNILELEVVIEEMKRLNNLIKDEILSKLIIESNSKKEINRIFAIKDVHTKQIFVGFSKRIDERIKEIFSMGIDFEQTELIYVSPFISNAVLLKRQITANLKASSIRQSWLDVSEEEFFTFIKEIEIQMILELSND